LSVRVASASGFLCGTQTLNIARGGRVQRGPRSVTARDTAAYNAGRDAAHGLIPMPTRARPYRRPLRLRAIMVYDRVIDARGITTIRTRMFWAGTLFTVYDAGSSHADAVWARQSAGQRSTPLVAR